MNKFENNKLHDEVFSDYGTDIDLKKHFLGKKVISSLVRKETAFYNDRDNNSESKRLDLMAEQADIVSLKAIRAIEGGRIADFGAGDSTSLGKEFERAGAIYIPLDQRKKAIDKHLQSGFDEARVASVDKSDLDDNSVDAVHSRFVLGWLKDPKSREDALKEMFRTTKPGGEIVIIDYDWNAIDTISNSNEELSSDLKSIFKVATDVMKQLGFNPYYGQEMHEDLSRISDNIVSDFGGKVTLHPSERKSIFKGSLKEASLIFEQTAESISTGLRQFGMTEKDREVSDAVVKLRELVRDYPDEKVKLADMVIQKIDLEENPNIAYSKKLTTPERACSPDEYTKIANWCNKQIVIAESREMINSLRRIQGRAYAQNKLIDESILENGILPKYNDSLDRVERSRYFTTIDDEGWQYCTVRYVLADEKWGLDSLREFRDMPEETREKIRNKYKPEQVVAISAFAKNFEGDRGSLEDVVGAVVGLVQHARLSGIKLGIMELEKDQYPAIQAVFGAENFEEISEPYALDIEGTKSDKKYIALQCHSDKFFDEMLSNAERNIALAKSQGRKPPEIFMKIKSSIDEIHKS